MSDGYEHWVNSDGAVVVMSQGLAEHGHPELVFVVRPPEGVDHAEVRGGIERLLDMLAGSVAQGQWFGAWSAIGTPPEGFLHPSVQGLVFVDPMGSFPEVPHGALLAILLFEPELELLQHTGAYRVVTRMGNALHAYPFPLVSSWERESVAREGDERSMNVGIPTVMFGGLTLTFSPEDTVLHVRAQPGHGEALQRVMTQLPSLAFSLRADVDPIADARFFWEPDQPDIAAISPPSSNGLAIAGGQLVVTVVDEREDVLQVIEDGFALVLTPARWAEFERAFYDEQPFTLTTANSGLGLSLTFRPSEDERDHIRLLVDEQQLARAVSIEALVPYIQAIDELLTNESELDVTVELRPGEAPSFHTSWELPVPLMAALRAVEPPEVRGLAPFLIHKA